VSLFAPAGDPPTSEGVFVWDELMTSDIEGAKRFYGEVVGWETEDMDMGEGLVYTMFKTGDAQRGGGMPIPEGVEAPPAWMTYIGTEDVDTTWAKAESLGAEAIRTPFDVLTVGRLAIFKDPTGAVIGIFAPNTQ
jgi:hypothetical protein